MLDTTLYQTPRLALRPPSHGDGPQVFQRIASDPQVTRFVAWPMHTSLRDTEAFLSFSQPEWTKWPVGPLPNYVSKRRHHTWFYRISLETSYRASTGFVLAKMHGDADLP